MQKGRYSFEYKEVRRLSKYNYVFFWSPEDYYKIAFLDILNNDNIRYITDVLERKPLIEKYVHRVILSNKINKIISMPLKTKWRNSYFINDFICARPIKFIFHGSFYWLKSVDYFRYLKNMYRNSSLVLLLMDTVDSYCKSYKNKYYGEFDIEYIKKNFEHILTYNKFDAEKYGFIYYPSIYSAIQYENNKKVESDVLFVGKAKDRLDAIHKAYRSLKLQGFSCDFYITDVPRNKMLYPEIHYNYPMPYYKVLEKVWKSRGILEIVQRGSLGFTFRLDEAIVYDKNIITNNFIVNDIRYGKSNKIFRFSEEIEIDINRYRIVTNESFNYSNDYSPIKLLEFMDYL